MIDLVAAKDPEPEEKLIIKGKLFVPIIDNGQGDVRANFLLFFMQGFRDREINVERFSDSLAPRARNKAAASFLLTDCEYLLFVDSDILFSKDHIDMLMESEEPVLAGLYCKKSKGVDPCLNTLPGMEPTETGGYIPIKRAGTGFIRIHRDVLEKMKEICPKYTNHGRDEWDFFQVGVASSEYLSEDWYFCDNARSLGYTVMLDSRIQLRHEGFAIYPIDETIPKDSNGQGNGVVIVNS